MKQGKTNDMDKAQEEKIRAFYETLYRMEVTPDAVAVVSAGKPGKYNNNPTLAEYEAKGYRLIDANMFGRGSDSGEIFIFAPSKSQ